MTLIEELVAKAKAEGASDIHLVCGLPPKYRLSGDVVNIMEAARAAGAAKRILIAGKATVTAEAAKAFSQAGICLIGNESQAVGPEDAPKEVHLILLGAGIALLEGIVLDDVPEGRYFLSAAPLNFGGCDGAPCRAYLIKS